VLGDLDDDAAEVVGEQGVEQERLAQRGGAGVDREEGAVRQQRLQGQRPAQDQLVDLGAAPEGAGGVEPGLGGQRGVEAGQRLVARDPAGDHVDDGVEDEAQRRRVGHEGVQAPLPAGSVVTIPHGALPPVVRTHRVSA